MIITSIHAAWDGLAPRGAVPILDPGTDALLCRLQRAAHATFVSDPVPVPEPPPPRQGRFSYDHALVPPALRDPDDWWHALWDGGSLLHRSK